MNDKDKKGIIIIIFFFSKSRHGLLLPLGIIKTKYFLKASKLFHVLYWRGRLVEPSLSIN
jgi:hypothetical protein